MTPYDIEHKQFTRGMGGYKAEEVNEFLNEVSLYIRDILAERNELQEKLELLAEKLEEYRKDEESLRSALIGAQKLGDNVIKDSRNQAEVILADARREAQKIVGNSKLEVESITYELGKKKHEVAKFKSQILSMYKQQVELINSTPYDEDKLPPMPSKPISANDSEPDGTESAAERDDVVDTSVIRLDYEQMENADDPFPQRRQRDDLKSFFGAGKEPKRIE